MQFHKKHGVFEACKKVCEDFFDTLIAPVLTEAPLCSSRFLCQAAAAAAASLFASLLADSVTMEKTTAVAAKMSSAMSWSVPEYVPSFKG